MKHDPLDLEEGEMIVETKSICEECGESIFFGTAPRPPKKYDKHYMGWARKSWHHFERWPGSHDYPAQCAPRAAKPISGMVLS